MTTTTAPTPPWSPRVAAWTATAGGLCFLLGFGLTPWESWNDTQAYHDGLAANAGRTELSTVLSDLDGGALVDYGTNPERSRSGIAYAVTPGNQTPKREQSSGTLSGCMSSA